MPCCDSCRGEFRRSHLCFGDLRLTTKTHSNLDWFTQFADGGLFFHGFPKAYVAFRIVLAIGAIALLIDDMTTSITTGEYYFMYLTNISFIFVTIYLILVAGVTLQLNLKRSKAVRAKNASCFLRFLMVLQHINIAVAIGVTIIYFLVLYNAETATYLSILMHTVNSILMILDLVFSLQPVYLVAALYPILFSLLYTLWTGIHYAAGLTSRSGCRCIYNVLHWGEDPGEAAIYSFGSGLVLMPLLILIMWLIKSQCILKSCRRAGSPEPASKPTSTPASNLTGTEEIEVV